MGIQLPIDLYVSCVSPSVWVTSRFRGSPYGFRFVRGASHADLFDPKLTEFQKRCLNF